MSAPSRLRQWAVKSEANLLAYLVFTWLMLICYFTFLGALFFLLVFRSQMLAAVPLAVIFYLWWKEVFDR